MAKKLSLPKWGKVFLWVLGVLVGLILVVGIGFKIWVSTWPHYEKYGVSFKYPPTWAIEDLKPNDPGKQKYPYDQQYLISINNVPFLVETTNVDQDECARIGITRYSKDKLGGITADNLLNSMRSGSKGKLSSVNNYYLGLWKVLEDVDIGKTEKMYTYMITTDRYVYSVVSIIFTENRPFWKIAWYDVLSSKVIKSFKFVE
jgi:hypothetical protein